MPARDPAAAADDAEWDDELFDDCLDEVFEEDELPPAKKPRNIGLRPGGSMPRTNYNDSLWGRMLRDQVEWPTCMLKSSVI